MRYLFLNIFPGRNGVQHQDVTGVESVIKQRTNNKT